MPDKIQMILMMKTSISNNRISWLNYYKNMLRKKHNKTAYFGTESLSSLEL